MQSFATYDLVKYRQQELLAEAEQSRLVAQAKAQRDEVPNAPWESRIGRVRHAFAAFAALPRWPQAHIARSASRA